MNDQLIFADHGLISSAEFGLLSPLEQHAVRYGLSGGGDDWCYGSIQAAMLRVAKLTANGAPLTGAGNGLATDALVEITVDPELETGVNLRYKNGQGNICQTFRDCDRLVGLTLAMQLCHLDAQLIAFLTGGSAIFDLGGPGVGDVIGFEFPASDASCPNGASLETWSKAWNGGAQAQPTFLGGGTNAYFHWIFPRTRWQIGQLKQENDFMRVTLNGFAQENDEITANGPFDDWPADLAAYGGITNVGGWVLDSAIPTASCEAITVSSAAS